MTGRNCEWEGVEREKRVESEKDRKGREGKDRIENKRERKRDRSIDKWTERVSERKLEKGKEILNWVTGREKK